MNRISLLILFGFLMLAAGHPLHVSITNLQEIPNQNKWLVTCKMFTDDLYEVLVLQYGQEEVGEDQVIAMSHKPILTKYIGSHLQIRINGIKIPIKEWRLVKIYSNHEASFIEYEFDFQGEAVEFSIKNTLLFDIYNDQKNLLFVGSGKKEKAFQFNRKDGFFTFRF